MRTAVHDAAKAAAIAERDRLGTPVSDYVVGRLTEAALAVALNEPAPPEPAVLEAESWEE